MPLILTEQAIVKLEGALELRRKRPEELYRLVVTASGGFAMRLEKSRPGDVIVDHDDRPLLALDPALADGLADSTLDVGRGPDEPEWVLLRHGGSDA